MCRASTYYPREGTLEALMDFCLELYLKKIQPVGIYPKCLSYCSDYPLARAF